MATKEEHNKVRKESLTELHTLFISINKLHNKLSVSGLSAEAREASKIGIKCEELYYKVLKGV